MYETRLKTMCSKVQEIANVQHRLVSVPPDHHCLNTDASINKVRFLRKLSTLIFHNSWF